MRMLTLLLLLLALSILALFLKPLFDPGTVQGPRPESFSSERVQAVSARATVPASGPREPVESPPMEAPADAVPTGPLCDRKFDAGSARPLAIPAGRVIREGADPGNQPWTWINVWAVWCKPCKEEMPLLSSWARGVGKKGGALKVVFLSVDDDERQLSRFMGSRGTRLGGEFLWVQEEAPRKVFYQSLGLDDTPTLPVHVLLDPRGRLRCVRVGSVTSADLHEAAERFGFQKGI